MKAFFLLTSIAAFTLCSCGNESNEQKNNSPGSDSLAETDSANTDTLPASAIALSLGGDTIDPADASLVLYRFDEKMIRENEEPLSLKEVRRRFMPVDPQCESESAFALKRLFWLDSMNRAGDESYRDLGQIVKVEVRLIDTIPLSADFTTVAWTIYYSTYEACPFSAGTYYMVSTYDKGKKLIATQLIGQQTGGGDAPISFSSVIRGNLFRDGSFKSLQADTTEDGDVEGKDRYEVVRKIYRGTVNRHGHIVRETIELNK